MPVIDITHGGDRRAPGREFRISLAMRTGNRQHAPGHALKPRRRHVFDGNQHGAPLKLLALVGHKARPILRSGHQRVQLSKHLTAIADPQSKGVAAKEALKRLPQRLIKQNGFGPTAATAQNISIGKTTTGHQRRKIIQQGRRAEQIAHMHINRSEAGSLESRSHLDLSIHALLPQDRYAGSCGVYEGSGDICINLKGQRC